MSKLTVTIPDDLHQKIREELERQGITTSQFIEQAITTFFEKPKGVRNMATRTLPLTEDTDYAIVPLMAQVEYPADGSRTGCAAARKCHAAGLLRRTRAGHNRSA